MFSLIICTYNPDPVKFNRVLNSIESQLMPSDEWEWIIVDNASSISVSSLIPDHLKNRIIIIRENEAGLTPARLCGINAAKNEWLVFIDDDNVLRSDYLLSAKQEINKNNRLGALGGRLVPEYEVKPSQEVTNHLFMLAIRTPEVDIWGKDYTWDITPFGAGMVIRRSVAVYYAALLKEDVLRRSLDRKGSSLMSSGDIDMVHTAVDLGWEIGVFTSLELIHIIPATRINKKYLINMMRYNALSNHLLFYIRFKRIPKQKPIWRRIKQHLRLWKNGDWFESKMLQAQNWGTRSAIERIKAMSTEL